MLSIQKVRFNDIGVEIIVVFTTNDNPISIAGSSTLQMKFRKPSGTVVTRTAAFVAGSNTSITYTTKDLRSQSTIQKSDDVKFTNTREGKFVFKINGFNVTVIPVVIQIKRSSIRDPTGDIAYQIVANAKVISTKL